ncbi:hypothetical protein ACLOJK_030142 [Asimina triloba]
MGRTDRRSLVAGSGWRRRVDGFMMDESGQCDGLRREASDRRLERRWVAICSGRRRTTTMGCCPVARGQICGGPWRTSTMEMAVLPLSHLLREVDGVAWSGSACGRLEAVELAEGQGLLA